MGGACSTCGAKSVYRVLVGPEGKRPLRRPRRRWEDNIYTYLQAVGWGAWTGSSWLRIRTDEGNCECGKEPSVSIKSRQFLE